MIRLVLLALILVVPSLVMAQTQSSSAAPGVQLQDEGVVAGQILKLNCVGAGVTCTRTGALGTMTVTGGGGGAPTTYAYWGSGSDATLSAEINLAALSTGLVLNTAGTPSTYAGVTCTNQVIRLLSASGVATCQTITSAYVDTSIWTGTVASGLLKASSQGILAQAVAGTDYAAASHTHVDADIPDTITLTNLTQIGTRQISDTTGTLQVGRGGTALTTFAVDSIPLATALDTLAAVVLPSCSNATTSKLLYNTTTHAFSCGTDQTGGGGALTISSTEIDFGAQAKFVAVATVTDAGVSGASKILTWQGGGAATGRQSDENEMDAITCNANPGTGSFTLRCHTNQTVTHGLFPVLYTVQ